MSSHQQLFYNKNYSKIIQDLSSNQDPSIQETHNLAICKYLANGESPISDLMKLCDTIRQDLQTPNQWPANPSWPLILYHVALYSLKFCSYEKTQSILNDLWNNYDKQDKFLMLSITVLTIELACRSNLTNNIEKAFNYIKTNFSTPESIQAILQTKNIDSNTIQYYIDTIQFSKFKVDVAQLLNSKVDENTKEIYHKFIQGIDISETAKQNPKLPVVRGIPLSSLAYHFGDMSKSNSILETITPISNFAVYNNLGIFELIHGHYNSALLHFSRALSSRSNNQLFYPYHQISYNLGLSLLQKHKPKRAFKYLHSVIPLMRNSPYLWLRLSECIVMYYKQRIAKLRQRTQVSPVIAQKLCTSTQTYYLLPASDSKLFELDQNKNPEMTLDFGANCARNCIMLCTPEQTEIANRARMLCSFICLEIGAGKMASDMCNAVINSPGSDKQQQQFLAKIYSVQGIMLSDDIESASRVMSRMILESSFTKEKDLNTLNYLTFARVHMSSHDKEGHISQTDIKNAENMLSKAVEADPKRPETVLTSILFKIMRRHVAHAAQEIKDYCDNADKGNGDDSD